jgi:hypothetical protein
MEAPEIAAFVNSAGDQPALLGGVLARHGDLVGHGSGALKVRAESTVDGDPDGDVPVACRSRLSLDRLAAPMHSWVAGSARRIRHPARW